ncbi:hypothetical protein ACOMHN_014442 [Nucella lapillus]
MGGEAQEEDGEGSSRGYRFWIQRATEDRANRVSQLTFWHQANTASCPESSGAMFRGPGRLRAWRARR